MSSGARYLPRPRPFGSSRSGPGLRFDCLVPVLGRDLPLLKPLESAILAPNLSGIWRMSVHKNFFLTRFLAGVLALSGTLCGLQAHADDIQKEKNSKEEMDIFKNNACVLRTAANEFLKAHGGSIILKMKGTTILDEVNPVNAGNFRTLNEANHELDITLAAYELDSEPAWVLVKKR
jgi:hypothetical protein